MTGRPGRRARRGGSAEGRDVASGPLGEGPRRSAEEIGEVRADLLHNDGVHRFVELQRRLGTITPKTLTERLRQLERDGLVVREVHAEVPPRVEYAITDLGRSLAPVFAALATWTDEHLPEVERARAAYAGPLPR